MDKKFYIAANWKMNGSLSFINDYFSNFSSNSENTNEMIICPSDIYLDSVMKNAPDFIQIGGTEYFFS
ncbi:triose-phosphate isomerase [Gammaproteobacteria bacterium]|nr:triose-phosphate isomerase [Gammaproteobacteria bacterium]